MIDVLIVEDEPAILMGIMQLVESLELPIEVQGGCGNLSLIHISAGQNSR